MQINSCTTSRKGDTGSSRVYPPTGTLDYQAMILADGITGRAEDRIASEMACTALQNVLEHQDPRQYVFGGHRLDEHELMRAFLVQAIRQVGTQIWHEGRRRSISIGTSVMVVLLREGHGYCACAGDASLYVAEPGQWPPVQVTAEHSRNGRVTRWLGAEENVMPDVVSFAFDADSALVMGSSAFWRHMPGERMAEWLTTRPIFCVVQELAQAVGSPEDRGDFSVLVLEGEAFIACHADAQITSLSQTLSQQGIDSASTALRRGLVEFCVQHPSPVAIQIIKDVLAHLPDAVQILKEIKGRLSQNLQLQLAQAVADQTAWADVFIEVRVKALIEQDRHDAEARQLYDQYLTSCPDDAEVRLHLAQCLLEANLPQAASNELEAVIARQELRSQVTELLQGWLSRIGDAVWRPEDSVLYNQYLELVPDDSEIGLNYGLKLWQAGDHAAAWPRLRQAYEQSPESRSRVAALLRDPSAHATPKMLDEFVETAMRVRGPGIAWALEQQAQNPAQQFLVTRNAGIVAYSWPLPDEARAAQQLLKTLEQQQTTSSLQWEQKEREYLLRIAELEAVREQLQHEMKSARGDRSQTPSAHEAERDRWRQRAAQNLQIARRLGQVVIGLSQKYPKQTSEFSPNADWAELENWLQQDGSMASAAQLDFETPLPPPRSKSQGMSRFSNALLLVVITFLGVAVLITAGLGLGWFHLPTPVAMLTPTPIPSLIPTVLVSPSVTPVGEIWLPTDTPTPIPDTPTPGPPPPATATPASPPTPEATPPTVAPALTPVNEPRTVTLTAPSNGIRLKSSRITFRWYGGALQPGEAFVVQIIPSQAEKNGQCTTESDYGSGGSQYSPSLTAHEWTTDIAAVPMGKFKPCAGRIEWRVHIREATGRVVQSTPRGLFDWNPL